jgi:hypothetical protein
LAHFKTNVLLAENPTTPDLLVRQSVDIGVHLLPLVSVEAANEVVARPQ